MDPNTSTCEQFTKHLTSKLTPDFAAPEWKELAETLKTLLDKLAHHPAMAMNLQQTYMTPANSKNNVYFMWDFMGRTLSYLYMINPALQNLTSREKDTWKEAEERATYAKMLITDQMPGMLDMMTEQTYPGQMGQHPKFGEDILEVARHLK